MSEKSGYVPGTPSSACVPASVNSSCEPTTRSTTGGRGINLTRSPRTQAYDDSTDATFFASLVVDSARPPTTNTCLAVCSSSIV